MTLPNELVKAAHDAMRERWYDTTSEAKARCAVAAVLRALPENVVPAVWAHRMPSGNFHRFHGKDSVHMDGCIPLYDLAAIAKLADDA